jgi:hypothetical protein
MTEKATSNGSISQTRPRLAGTADGAWGKPARMNHNSPVPALAVTAARQSA